MSSATVCLAIFVTGLMVGCRAKPSDTFARVPSSYPGGSKWVLYHGDSSPPPNVVQIENVQVLPANRYQSHHQPQGHTGTAVHSDASVKTNAVQVPAAAYHVSAAPDQTSHGDASFHSQQPARIPEQDLLAPIPPSVSSDQVAAAPATAQQPPKPIDLGTLQASQITPRPVGDYAPEPQLGDSDTVIVDSKPVQNNDWYMDGYVPDQYQDEDYYPQYENDYEKARRQQSAGSPAVGAAVVTRCAVLAPMAAALTDYPGSEKRAH